MRRMKRRNSQGQTFIEFLFVLLWAVPFLLITLALGINLIEGLEVMQLARDAASMYARQVNFTQPSSQAILDEIGNGLNLHSASPSTSQAVVIMSELTYMDATCSAAIPSGCGCANSNKWVFIQYQVLPAGGNVNIATKSRYGDPSALVDAANPPKIDICDAATNAAAVAANFGDLGITSWSTTGASLGYGVPSGLGVYLVEVTASGYAVPPLVNGPVKLYNYAVF